jgi:hypothetical protein
VTRKKNWRPADAVLSSDENLQLEAFAMPQIENIPTLEWEGLSELWRQLPSAWVSTRARILRRILELAVERGEPWPAELVKLFAAAAIPTYPKAKARDRVRDSDRFRAAVRLARRNPRMAFRAIAKVVGVSPSTMHEWKQSCAWTRLFEDPKLTDAEIWTARARASGAGGAFAGAHVVRAVRR